MTTMFDDDEDDVRFDEDDDDDDLGPIALRCPTCNADPGEPCTAWTKHRRIERTHESRVKLWGAHHAREIDEGLLED